MNLTRWMTVLGVGLLVAGCAKPERCGMIPLGEWCGQGTFVYEMWGEGDEPATQPAEPRSLHRTYSTRLTIRRLETDGPPTVELDILSERGPIPDLGDETHLMLALVEAKKVSDSVVLYRMPDWEFNPRPDESLDLDKRGAPFAASCFKTDGTTVLHIRYDEDFSDTFRFHGRRLEKHGLLHTDDGLLHWCEKLKRRE